MSSQARLQKAIRAAALSFAFIASIAVVTTTSANAQGVPYGGSSSSATPLPNNLVNWLPANTAPATSNPPPVGSGTTAPVVIPGDSGSTPTAAPTGTAQTNPINGSWFSTQNATARPIIYVFRQSSTAQSFGLNRGTRMDFTIRPDSLTATQYSQIQGILGVTANGQTEVDVVATNDQIAQISTILAPYPQTQQQGNWQVITSDTPAQGYPKAGEQSAYTYQGPLPTVKTFSRYLVILGCVVATIFMALAAYSMVLGHPYGGSRVIGTAAGFMLLLCGFTIWKIVQMNTFNAMSNLPPINQSKQGGTGAALQAPVLPAVPTGQGRATPVRSGIPVLPLSGN